MTQLNHDDFLEQETEFDAGLLQAEADIKAGKKSKDHVKACSSTIMTMDISHKMFLVGDVFMRKYYTIFNRDTDQVGLAKAKGYVNTKKTDN